MALRSTRIVTPDGEVDGYLVLDGGTIGAVGPADPGVPVVDVRPAWLLPGLIDLHIHGAGGWAVAQGDPEVLRRLARFVASGGVTAFHATLAAASAERLVSVARAVAELMAEPGSGVLGLHAEGPFINPDRIGAMDIRQVRPASVPELEALERAAPGALRHLTLAPEADGAVQAIRWACDRGILVAAGHTDASVEQTQAAIDAGVRLGNHTFNAMRAFNHRDPGPLAALLADPRVALEVIADGVHVHPAALRLLAVLCGPDRVALVSDAVAPAGLAAGSYRLFGMTVIIDDAGCCRQESGTIAGSTRMLIDGVRTMVEQAGVCLADAVTMASATPARLAGYAGSKGRLVAGFDADVVVVSPDWQVQATVAAGRLRHQQAGGAPPTRPGLSFD